MKKFLSFSLFLIITTIFLGLVAAQSSNPDKNKTKAKNKKERPTQLMILRDTTNCANYYEANCIIQQASHNISCPSDCTIPHTKIIVKSKTLKTCPKGKLYNPQKLACDFPEHVICPHTPKCTN